MAERTAPLVALERRIAAAACDGVVLRAVPFLVQVGIRLDPADPAARRVAAAMGVELPTANRVSEATGRRLLWLGPDEWLVVAADTDQQELVTTLTEAIGVDGCVVDLSANRTGLELTGALARDVLSTCCSLDFHSRVFGPGQCAQTLIQKAGVLIDQRSDDTYLLLVRPSFAAYVAEWLIDGMAGLAADLNAA